jgi:hypothetical protein
MRYSENTSGLTSEIKQLKETIKFLQEENEIIKSRYNLLMKQLDNLLTNKVKKWKTNHSPVIKSRSQTAIDNGKFRKLTEKQVLEIREKFSFGISTKILSEQYGVNTMSIYNIVHRRTWTHI